MLNLQSHAAGQVVSQDEHSQSSGFIWNILKCFSCREKCLCRSKYIDCNNKSDWVCVPCV